MVQFEVPAIVPADPQANVTDLLVDRVKATPQLALFAVPDGDGWRDITAAEFHAQVIALAKGFVAAGIEPGDKVGFIARTTYDWTLVDFALFFAGAVMVPIYETSSPAQIAWNLTDSGAIACIVESADHSARLDEIRADVPLVRSVWEMHRGDLDKLVAQGKDVTDAEIERRRNIANGSDIATLIYTSGSTGRPKGCVLTHSNFVELVRNSAKALNEVVETPGRVDAAVHHDGAHLRAVHLDPRHPRGREDRPPARHEAASARARLVQADVPARGAARVREGVQLVRAEGRGRRQGQDLPRRRAHRDRALEAAAGRQEDPVRHEDQVRPVRPARLQQAARGHGRPRRVRGVGLGSARPAPRALLPQPRHHDPRGLRPHRDDGSRHGQPGDASRRSAPSVPRSRASACGIADDGEIQVRGVNVFKEYWRNPEATAATFDGDWFKTGDIGAFDSEGFLTITGPQEGDHRHGRRQERRPRRARGPDPRQPDRRAGRRRRRSEAVHLGAGHPRQRDAPDVARQQQPAHRHVADGCREEPHGPRRGAARDRRARTRTSRAPSRSASSRSSTRSGPRPAATSRRR